MSDYQSAALQQNTMGQLGGGLGGGYGSYSAEQLRLLDERQKAAEAVHKIKMDREARASALDFALRHERSAEKAILDARKFAAFLSEG